jgi:hypothetical protein
MIGALYKITKMEWYVPILGQLAHVIICLCNLVENPSQEYIEFDIESEYFNGTYANVIWFVMFVASDMSTSTCFNRTWESLYAHS